MILYNNNNFNLWKKNLNYSKGQEGFIIKEHYIKKFKQGSLTNFNYFFNSKCSSNLNKSDSCKKSCSNNSNKSNIKRKGNYILIKEKNIIINLIPQKKIVLMIIL